MQTAPASLRREESSYGESDMRMVLWTVEALQVLILYPRGHPEDERHRHSPQREHRAYPAPTTTAITVRLRPGPRPNTRSRSRKPHGDENGICYGFLPACPQAHLRLSSASFPEPTPPSPLQRDADPVFADGQAREQPVTDITETGQQQAPDLEPLPDGNSHWESTSKPRQLLMSATEQPHQHHHRHHVPDNAFLSVGLQTSLAIAFHKLPEGLITYATNYALGVTVFLALFIHNITDGFAMALSLYLALNSRWKAILWWAASANRLGWIRWARCAGDTTAPPPWGLYGGIMASVGVQLLGEGLRLMHHQGLCIGSAIAGGGRQLCLDQMIEWDDRVLLEFLLYTWRFGWEAGHTPR
ncbi:hypothetical protein V8E54_003603 [Elaphomyces granulatus]